VSVRFYTGPQFLCPRIVPENSAALNRVELDVFCWLVPGAPEVWAWWMVARRNSHRRDEWSCALLLENLVGRLIHGKQRAGGQAVGAALFLAQRGSGPTGRKELNLFNSSNRQRRDGKSLDVQSYASACARFEVVPSKLDKSLATIARQLSG